MKFLRFLTYNNAVPITISLVLLGAGSAYAAGNPEAILASEQTVLSVDNTYIANKDLSAYTPRVEIKGVTEDDENYYVTYDVTTIDIRDYVWQDYTRNERMVILKKGLEGDLGLYVTKRLRDVIANELVYLSQVQDKERKAVTQQTIATTYSGLVGKFLDATTETLPGYTPVIAPPPAPLSQAEEAQAAAVAAAQGSSGGSSSAPQSSGAAQVSLQVLGNNPASVPLRSQYVDLGVVLLDPFNTNVGVHTFLDGVETSSPVIDTTVTGVHTIEYRVTDRAGVAVLVRRIVLVGDATSPGGEISSTPQPVAPPAAAPAPTPVVVPTPTPTPEPAPVVEPTPEVVPEPVAPPVEESQVEITTSSATTTQP